MALAKPHNPANRSQAVAVNLLNPATAHKLVDHLVAKDLCCLAGCPVSLDPGRGTYLIAKLEQLPDLQVLDPELFGVVIGSSRHGFAVLID